VNEPTGKYGNKYGDWKEITPVNGFVTVNVLAPWTVTFYASTTAASSLSSQIVLDGKLIDATKVVKPVADGYKFGGWATADGKAFDIAKTAITADTNLYAIWKPVKAAGPTIDTGGSVSSTGVAGMAGVVVLLGLAAGTVLIRRRVVAR